MTVPENARCYVCNRRFKEGDKVLYIGHGVFRCVKHKTDLKVHPKWTKEIKEETGNAKRRRYNKRVQTRNNNDGKEDCPNV